jgi:hypothetical protein
MTITLSQPISLTGDWESLHFDATHNHFLCLKENTLYRFSLNDPDPAPVEIFKHTFMTPKLKLIKLSICREIIAAQISSTAVMVFDLSSDKKWKIDIKGNEILNDGMIWSEHSGNSEDLIIVTNKGIELYKVNIRKSYCRVSRILSQPILNYWYNVENRMILLATSKKPVGSASEFMGKITKDPSSVKELLVMDGYFLKAEKPNIPMLELPPPDKIPRFELGPGVDMDCIHLVTVYGKLLTLVRYSQDSEGFFGVYQITKTSIDKLFSLAIGQLSKEIYLSTYDNLIICHDLKNKTSIMFDIMKTPRDRVSRASSLTIDPVLPASVISYTSRFVEEEFKILKYKENKNASASFIIGDVDFDKTSILENGIPQVKRADSIKFVSNADEDEDLGFDTSRRNVNDIRSLRFDYIELDTPIPAYPFYSDAIYQWCGPNLAYDTDAKVIWKIQCKFDSTAKLIEDYREKTLFLTRRGRKYLYIKTLSGNSSSSNNSSANPSIKTNIPPPSNLFNISQESQLAKIAMLRIFYDSLEEKINISFYYSFFFGLCNSYVLEAYRFLTFRGIKYNTLDQVDLDLVNYLKIQYTVNNDAIIQSQLQQSNAGNSASNANNSNNNAANFTPVNPASSTSSNSTPTGGNNALIKPIVSTFRKQSIGEKVLQRVMNRGRTTSTAINYNNITNDSLIVLDSDAAIDIDPLEPNMTSILPAVTSTISTICDKVKAQLTAGNAPAGTGRVSLPLTPFPAEKGLFSQPPLPVPHAATSASASSASTSLPVPAPGNYSSPLPATANSSGKRTLSEKSIKIEQFPLNTRRDEKGDLIITQTECLYYVWLPILLSDHVNYEYCAEVLTIYITTLLDQGMEILPSLLYLHIQLFFALQKYNEINNLLQYHHFYSACVPVARCLLNFAVILEEELSNLPSSSTAGVPNLQPFSKEKKVVDETELIVEEEDDYYYNKEQEESHNYQELIQLKEISIQKFRFYAEKMLRKNQEMIALIKADLMQGNIYQAMELCQQSIISPSLFANPNPLVIQEELNNGKLLPVYPSPYAQQQQQTQSNGGGLLSLMNPSASSQQQQQQQSVTLTSAEFFIATIETFRGEKNSFHLVPSMSSPHPNNTGGTASSSSGNVSPAPSSSALAPAGIVPLANQLRSLSLFESTYSSTQRETTIFEKIRLLYAVYCFLYVWDRGILERSMVRSVSILSR